MSPSRSRRPVLLPFVLVALVGILAPGAAAQGADPAPESGSSDWIAVDAGGSTTCGIRASRRLYCWGDNASGQVGRGTAFASTPTPLEVAGGQLGNGAPLADQLAPVLVAGGITNWTSLSAGDDHTCGRRANGRVHCWGDDGDGQLGNGLPETDQPAPVLVAGGITTWTSVTTGNFHSCGRQASGILRCWGRDIDGLLGNGLPVDDRAAPVVVAGGFSDWTAASAGAYHTCAHRAAGRVYCWGDDDTYGQLGTSGPNTDRAVPTVVSGGFTNWTAVTAGRWHACGRRATGRLYCWGSGTDGQIGDGGFLDWNFPVAVAGSATDWTQITAGDYHSCARTTARRLYCWGDDVQGQLGTLGANADETRPAEVHVP